MRNPKIGDIVHYSYVIDSAPYAAIILKIENKDIFILKVFDRELEDGDDEVIRCSYSQMPKAYHWSWPEEENCLSCKSSFTKICPCSFRVSEKTERELEEEPRCTCPTEIKASYTLCLIHDGKQEEKDECEHCFCKECMACGDNIYCCKCGKHDEVDF